jgi:hypothetical protein
VVHRPSLATEKDVEPLVAGSNPHAGELLEPLPQGLLVGPSAALAHGGARSAHRAAGPPLGEPVDLPLPPSKRLG